MYWGTPLMPTAQAQVFLCSGQALALVPYTLLLQKEIQVGHANTPRIAKQVHMHCFLLPWGGFAT